MPNTPAYAGPTVRKLAREFGLDLTQVTGTGEGGRVQTEDLYRHVQQALARGTATPSIATPSIATLSAEADITDLETLIQHFSPPIPLLSFIIKAAPFVPITIILETPDGPRTKILTKTETKGLRAITADLETPPPANAPPTTLTVAQPETKPVWTGETFTPRRILTLTLNYNPSMLPSAEALQLLSRLTTTLADFHQTLL